MANYPNSLPFSWLKNCLDQHDPSTTDIFSYIYLQCKLLKDQEIATKQTGTSADQQRKDVSAARYPASPNIHAIADSSPQLDPVLDLDPPTTDVTLPPDEDYSYQDETEAITSVSYDNDEVIDDFNYKNRAVVYSDVLDQKSYIPYVHETYFYPNQDPASFSALTTSPVTPVNKKDLPCFKFANQNCDLSDNCPYSLKRKRSQSTLTPIIPESPDLRKLCMTKIKKRLSLTTSLLHPVLLKSISIGQGHRPTMSAMWNNPAISLHNFNDLAHHYDDTSCTQQCF